MPLLRLETTISLSDDKRKALLASLSNIVAETIGKPLDYVMVTIVPADMLMSGKPGDAAFVDIRSIGGLSAEVNRKLSKEICELLTESLTLASGRIYLNFTELKATDWGWQGNTFG